MKKHNNMLDMLRFFAAMAVVFFHLNQAIPNVDNWYRNTVKLGWMGVPVFFVISGYCIIMAAHNARQPGEFLTKRFFRIFPPYWASLLIVLVAAVFQKWYIGDNAVHDIPRSWKDIVATITLTTTPLTHIKTMNWVYWTLTCEVFFYIVVGLTMFFDKKLMPCFLVAIAITALFVPEQKSGPLFFLDQWPAFGLGGGIFFYFKDSNTYGRLWFGAIILINVLALTEKFGFSGYAVVTFVAATIVFTSNFFEMPPNIFSALGQHSYSVYLIHVPVGVFILGLFEPEYAQKTPLINLIYDIGVLGIISLAAWVNFKYVESPSMKAGRKLYNKFFSVSKPVVPS